MDMSNFKQSELIITLSCRGEDLYSLNSRDYIEEISIGRNSDCTWSVGFVDSSTSSRHAIISKRKNDLFLTDLGSRNGTFLRDRKIKEVKLAPGMLFHFGECSITVADPNVKSTSELKKAYLRYTDEQGKNRKFKLNPGIFKIGAGEKCDIVLNSGLVSTPHASVNRKKDGSCWIKDLKSRNGTSVNGVELNGKVERMLKNGDVISVADIEITFFDGSSERHVMKLKAALITLFLTILACAAGYFCWLQLTPSSREFLQKSRQAARNSNFTEARQLVASAATARQSTSTQAERKLLLAQIEAWENSATRLKTLYALLKAKRFSEVPQLLGTMELEYISSWDWNEKSAVRIKQELELIRNLFLNFNRMEMAFNDRESDPAIFDMLLKEIIKTNAALRKHRKPETAELLKFSDNAVRKISGIRKMYEKYNRIIRELHTTQDSDLTLLIAELEKMRRTCRFAFIAGRVEEILPLLYSMQAAENQLEKCKQLFNGMRFSESISMQITVPENKLRIAGLDKRIAGLKREIAALKTVSRYLQILCSDFERYNIRPGRNIAPVVAFLNEKELSHVFACDTLRLAPVGHKRTAGSGFYDKYVGVEYLYGSLMMIRNYEPVRSRYRIPFESLLEQAVIQLEMVRHFKEYVSSYGSRYMTAGKLKDYIRYLDTQLLLRDRIVQDMKKRAAANRGKREYFIANGIAYTLSPLSYTAAQREQIGKEFTALRMKMQELSRQYNSLLPEDAIKIRELILRTGIPGDPAVKRMWSLR